MFPIYVYYIVIYVKAKKRSVNQNMFTTLKFYLTISRVRKFNLAHTTRAGKIRVF